MVHVIWLTMKIQAFFMVYQMALGTINFCFLDDEDRNDGSAEKPYYMSKSLRALAKSKPESKTESTESENSSKMNQKSK